jgi:hypothetical protein
LFLTITLVLGFVVGSMMFMAFTNMRPLGPEYGFIMLPAAFIAGLLMIPAQAISMAFYAKLEIKQKQPYDE